MISQVNRPLKCCTIKVRVLFSTRSGLSFRRKRMHQGGYNRGLIQWDTPNNKNTLLAVPGGMTHFNCAYTNLSTAKSAAVISNTLPLWLSGALCGCVRSEGSAILFLWDSEGLTETLVSLGLHYIQSCTRNWATGENTDGFDHLNLRSLC